MTDDQTRDDSVPAARDVDGLVLDPNRRSLTVDVAAYQHFLDGEDLSETEKRELIEALWEVVVSFVELGFSVSPREEAGSKNAPQIGTDHVQYHDPDDKLSEETSKESEDS